LALEGHDLSPSSTEASLVAHSFNPPGNASLVKGRFFHACRMRLAINRSARADEHFQEKMLGPNLTTYSIGI
jgi:hypothetical protein